MEQRTLDEIKQNWAVAIERLLGKIEELEQRLAKLESNNREREVAEAAAIEREEKGVEGAITAKKKGRLEGDVAKGEEGGSEEVVTNEEGVSEEVVTNEEGADIAWSVADVEKSGADAVANGGRSGFDAVETAGAEDAESVKNGEGETVTAGSRDEKEEEIHEEIEINWAGAESEPQGEDKREPGDEGEEEEGQEYKQESGEADWYDWEVDYPAAHIDNIYDGIGINDRYEFIRELFNPNDNLHEAELLFKRTIDDLNLLGSFKETVAYIRARFPQWDEYSDEVYRFYMIVRRKFN